MSCSPGTPHGVPSSWTRPGVECQRCKLASETVLGKDPRLKGSGALDGNRNLGGYFYPSGSSQPSLRPDLFPFMWFSMIHLRLSSTLSC